MNWRQSADGMMKWKSDREKGFQEFGRTKVRPVLKKVVQSLASLKPPEATGRARKMIEAEGG